MFFFKKKETKNIVEDEFIAEYEEAYSYGGGVGGYGLKLPKSKEGLSAGWWCPNCENIYSPKITECKECNRANDELRKAEEKRRKNTKQRRSTDKGN